VINKFSKTMAAVFTGFVAISSTSVFAEDLKVPRIVETYRIGDNAFVRALKVDEKKGSLWVGTSVGAMEVGLDKQDLRNVYTRKEGLANEYIFAIGVGPQNRTWLGTNAGGVSRAKEGGGWQTFFPMHGLADYWVYAFAFDQEGQAWIGTWDGVSVLDLKTDKFTTYRKELINVWVYGIDIDTKGRVWLGTEGGITMYDHGKWASWTSKDGLGKKNTEKLSTSPNTGLGTRSRHDLSVFDSGGAATYNTDYVFAVHVDNQDDQVWFGTWGGGASKFDGQKGWVSMSESDGLAGNIVYSIAQEKSGVLWFGTNNGLSRYDGKEWVSYNTSNGLIGTNVFAVEVTPNNDIWVGTKGGVTRLTYTPPPAPEKKE